MAVFGMLGNFVTGKGGEDKSKKKKKALTGDVIGEDLSLQEGFLKQTTTLKKILSKFYQDDDVIIDF